MDALTYADAMRAIQVTRFGPPEVLTLATVPDPTPAPGEVRVRVHATGVNFSDTERRRAVFDPPELPWIPGREAAGVIDTVGEGVDPPWLARASPTTHAGAAARTPSSPR